MYKYILIYNKHAYVHARKEKNMQMNSLNI